MNDMTAIRRAVDQILMGDLEPMLALLADDVVFQLAVGGDTHLCREEWGKEAVAAYFRMVGGMVAFWQMDYTAGGQHLIAWGRESFTVEPCGIEASSDFALVFDLSGGQITRFQVIEDLPSFLREASSLGVSSGIESEPEFSAGSWETGDGSLELEREFGDLVVSGEFPTP